MDKATEDNADAGTSHPDPAIRTGNVTGSQVTPSEKGFIKAANTGTGTSLEMKWCTTDQDCKEPSSSSTQIKETKIASPKFNVNEKLKETLEKHGIAKQNADSFLLGLLKDKDFKNLVKANMDDENSSDEDITDVRMTRSKLKEVMLNSPFKAQWTISPGCGNMKKTLPKFTEIPLPDNDEDDEEYKPMESSFGSDTQDCFPTEGEQKDDCDDDVNKKSSTDIPATEGTTIDPEVESSEPNELFIADNGHETEDDIISRRTRSKHSLESTSLDVLEAAFDPPDSTADMYNVNIGDYDWQKWLVDLMKDGRGNENATEEEDDCVADPDFSFTPELEEPDAEDLRDDFSVRVSKKELYGLLDEIENMDNDDWPAVTYVEHTSDSLDTSQQRNKNVKNKNSRSQNGQRNISQSEPGIPLLELSEFQLEMLRQQLQQHVQLLAQSNIICRNNADLADYVAESKELLFELAEIGQSQMDKLRIETSAVIPWNLKEALNLTEIDFPPSEPSVRLLRMERIKGHVSIPTSVAEVIGNSKVFMYKELLPISAPSRREQPQKLPFRPAEDCLVALGLAEMAGLTNHMELIGQHMLPTKTEKQIQARVRNVSYCRNSKDTVNPIRKYSMCNILPKPCTNVKYVREKAAKKPVDMKGMLPSWVLALKPMYVHEESSDDSVSDWGHPYIQSQPFNTPTNSVNRQIVRTSSPLKALMVPYTPRAQKPSIVRLGETTMPDQMSVQNSSNKQNSTSTVLNHASIISQPNKQGKYTSPASTSVVTTSVVRINSIHSGYGRRMSAGKSLKLSECEQTTASSSENEDDTEENEKDHTSDQAKGGGPHSDTEENLICIAESEEEYLSDRDNISGNKPAKELQKQVNVKLSKTEDGFSSLPIGGFMQKVHPKLSGKKSKSRSRDSRRLRSASKTIRALEEDTIVQLDPKRTEKERIFAIGYLERVEKVLKNHPETYRKFLDTLVKYSDGTKSPVDLHSELSTLLQEWPDLLQGFAPFLMPEQAQECGLNAEQEVYARARKFLRQLEIQFSNNPEHMGKILNVFHTVAGTAIYREEKMMTSILDLLKDYPFLQDEFLTFFDDQCPPKILFDEDFEEVDLSEELMKDPSISQYEQVVLPMDNREPDCNVAQENNFKRPKRRRISLEQEGSKSPVKVTENKENICPEMASLDEDDEVLNTDYDSEDAAMDDVNEDQSEILVEQSSASMPPDITVITEDAQSSSPFKRITDEVTKQTSLLRPDTPTGLRLDNNTRSLTLSSSPLTPPKSTPEEMPMVPTTPGKIQLQQGGNQPQENPSSVSWTREADELILTSCQQQGLTQEMFSLVAEKLKCMAPQVESRLRQLLFLLEGNEADDTVSQGSEEDGEVFESDMSCDSSATGT